jgi:hypothetical protein
MAISSAALLGKNTAGLLDVHSLPLPTPPATVYDLSDRERDLRDRDILFPEASCGYSFVRPEDAHEDRE